MISLIAAIDLNNGIGFKNNLLTHIPEDLKRFKQLTSNNIVVFGRNTFHSVGVLPKRETIVLTHSDFAVIKNAKILHSVSDILDYYKTKSDKELFICGGEQIYKQFLPYAQKAYLTIIHHKFNNVDSYFPKLDDSWKVNHDETLLNQKSKKDTFTFSFVTYENNSK